MEALLKRFTNLQVVAGALIVVVGLGAIWGLAHYTAAPGTEVNVGWVSYTKSHGQLQTAVVVDESTEVVEDSNSLRTITEEQTKREIASLRDQLEELIEFQSRRQIESLDPQSELTNLLSDLRSTEEQIREDAVTGLFLLRNPISYQPLETFLFTEVSKGHGFVAGRLPSEMFEILFDLNEIEATRFSAQIAGSIDLSGETREVSRSMLLRKTSTPESLKIAIGVFQELALESENTLIRTRAKDDLQHLKEKLERLNAERAEEG